MRFGVVSSYGGVGDHLRLAAEAEAAGWDGFFTWDGISIGAVDTWDLWVLLGAAALRTERVVLGAMIFPLARRRPWKVAREVLTVDHLSGGRLVLPVGLGVDADAGFSGVDGEAATPRERAQRLDEALAILDAAATGETFSYEGAHHRVRDMVVTPRPVQRPRVPVWPVVGLGFGRSMARGARWDGAVLQHARTDAPLTADDVRRAVEWFGEHRPGGLDGFEVVTQGELPDDRAAAEDHVAALAEAGATWWVESRWDAATATPEALLALTRQGPPRP